LPKNEFASLINLKFKQAKNLLAKREGACCPNAQATNNQMGFWANG
jgi:hypothetical protein